MKQVKDLRNFRFSIDRGGTFTDVYAEVPGEPGFRVTKLLSEDPDNYSDAPREGIRRILEEVTGIPHPSNQPVDTTRIEYIRMGTTVATNALLERKGQRCALVTTKGFRDLLYIGNQSRPRIFDLEIKTPEMLYDTVIEIDERVSLHEENNIPSNDSSANVSSPHYTTVEGVTGERITVIKAPDKQLVKEQLQGLLNLGIYSIAVVFLHSYTFRDHEKMVGSIAEDLGFQQVSLSSEIMPMVKMVPRGYTSCADAYLTPVIKEYVKSFCSGFDDGLDKVKISFMQSDGGLSPVETFSGHQAILSGPAGGVVGYSMANVTLEQDARNPAPLIGFDMGGTSSDVSRFDGSLEHVFETTIAGVTLQAPQLDIHTVAAGGGSRLFYRDGMFSVGPESAGAHPGPICYRKGGYLAVTDANLMLGRVLPEYFPKIFGINEDEPLDTHGTRNAFEQLQLDLKQRSSNHKDMTIDEIAYGFIRVANEAMCRPIRNLTQMKGYDITTHVLACFGGAGPQHACAMAKSLGMKKVFVHRFSGILSAYGLSQADIVEEMQEPCALVYNDSSNEEIEFRVKKLRDSVVEKLQDQGFSKDCIKTIAYLNMRYEGTDCSVMTAETSISSPGGLPYAQAFETHYFREFGFTLSGRSILIDDVRVRGVGKSAKLHSNEIALTSDMLPEPLSITKVYFEETGRVETPVYKSNQLKPGHSIHGPAIIMQNVATVVVEPQCQARITSSGDIEINIDLQDSQKNSPSTNRKVFIDTNTVDPIQLSIFSHRFMGIAEQMGRTLQRTSISVNIKERLDFSCALFGPDGGLVANAPHLPVHLGAMQQAVRFQLDYWKDNLVEGDVLLSNHPQLAGGSHLPDITVITPVFLNKKIVFFVASRGHHADIGGIAPGSMPPLSKSLVEEGAAIVAFKLVTGTDGKFQEEGITKLLQAPGKLPNNFGTRNLRDNLSDLRAQVAANTRGVSLMHSLIDEYSLEVVQAYMYFIQENAEHAVRQMLHNFSLSQKLPEVGSVHAEDYMDDGLRIQLEITIDRRSNEATFDFEGTDPQVFGNINAPPAVTYSAIIYCLRCLLVGHDIPLNQGCLNPIKVNIPKGCLLNPSDDAAVVGGNVLTSQRVTDVILHAFQACAASQGCMNNLTFGNESMGYYETIAGGAGAGSTWNGRSGVHTHMTNTRITDPEILERRYPVRLLQFSLRPNSGGKGKTSGGDGVVRELEFLIPLTVSILSERRSFQPYGLKGGNSGQRGQNLFFRSKDEQCINLGGKNTINVEPHDRLRILTPGGGGYGRF